jgi:hypothetical protein
MFKGSQASYKVLQPLPQQPEKIIKDEHHTMVDIKMKLD